MALEDWFLCIQLGTYSTVEAFVIAGGGSVKETWDDLPQTILVEYEADNISELEDHVNIDDVHGMVASPEITSYENTWGVNYLGAPAVHTAGNKGQNVVVCIVDTGGPMASEHEDLVSVDGINGINAANPWSDDHGHGTHVHGILAAVLNGIGVAGMAPEADIYHAKVLSASGSGGYPSILNGLQYCIDLTQGGTVTVVSNHSYGGSLYPGLGVEVAYQNAADAGVYLVCAAGNGGIGGGNTVGYPARFSSTIAVASIDDTGLRSSFSSVGPDVEIAAPGRSVYSCDIPNTYSFKSGTSMACPHIVGAFALAVNAGIQNIRDKIPESTDRDEHDIYYGYGILDLDKLLSSAKPNLNRFAYLLLTN
jgi:subtilisin